MLLPEGVVAIGHPLWRCVHALLPGFCGTACLQTRRGGTAVELWSSATCVNRVQVQSNIHLNCKHMVHTRTQENI